MSSPNTLHLKVMINKQKTKVLFAEANNDFVDILLSFLTLPLGKIASILSNPAIGSLNTLRSGLYHLDSSHFCVGGAKKMLLYPKSSFEAECRRLKLDISLTQSNIYFVCQEYNCPKTSYSDISLYSDIATCSCGKPLNREIYVGSVAGNSDVGVFTIYPSSFLITDDLRVAPIDTGFLQTLNNLGITDTAGSELQSVSFGMSDIMNLLKLSLLSATPLTDLVMKKTKKTEMSSASAAMNPESGLHHVQKSDANPRKMVLKVCMQKSTNKFVFAEATDVFVEFMFSLLTIPLGGVEFLLGGNTRLKNIDNLYRSIINMDNKFFTTTDMKTRLMNPKLAHGYVNGYKNFQFLPLSEERVPTLYYQLQREGWNSLTKKYEKTYYQFDHVNTTTKIAIKDTFKCPILVCNGTFLYARRFFKVSYIRGSQ